MLSCAASRRTAFQLLSTFSCFNRESDNSQSSFHAGDRVAVRWFYQGMGDYFSIWLHQGGEPISDLCKAERDGLCYDLTEDQTVILPSTGVTSGSDYTVTVTDVSSDASATSEPFTIIGDPYSNLQITQPDGSTSFSPGDEVEVHWLYVGENSLFDIYVRQGDGYDSRRVSENLCSLEDGGSCLSSTIGHAVVTLPRELEGGADYALLVVDRGDDDAHGMSAPIVIEIPTTSRTESASSGLLTGLSKSAEIGVLASIGVAGLFMCMLLAAYAYRRRHKRKVKISAKITDLDGSKPRRPAPTVTLSIEDMQQPVSPAESEDVSKNFINPIYSTSQNFYDGQITPPPDDSILWRKSCGMSSYVGRHISKSFSRSLTNIED